MERNAIVDCRIYHHSEGSGTCGSKEWSEIFLAHIAVGHRRRSAVESVHGCTVCHVVLHAHGTVVGIHVVGVVALESAHSLCTHHGVHQRVFAIALPHSWPRRAACEVESRSINPGNACSAGLIRADFASTEGNLAVERCSLVEWLGKQCSAINVGGSMVVVDTIYCGYAHRSHRFLLNSADYLLKHLGTLRTAKRSVENRANLESAYCGIESRAESEFSRLSGSLIVGHRLNGEFTHLPYFLVERHLAEFCFHLSLNLWVGRNAWFCCCHS